MRPLPFNPPRWRVWLANSIVLAGLIGFVFAMKWLHDIFTWRWSFGVGCGLIIAIAAARYFHGIWIGDDKHRIR